MRQAQLEYEMREKIILLRQELLFVAGNRKRTWDLLRRSPALLEVLDIREHRKMPDKAATRDSAARYLAAVEQMAVAVDAVLGGPGPSRPRAL